MLSQTTEYALRAMSWLAMTPEALVPTAQLAESTQVPPHYLAKVLQQLSAAGLIRGRRGVRGGYQLNRDPADVTLLDVVRAVTEVNRITTCPLGLDSHGSTLCPLHKKIDAAAKAVIDIYSDVTLADLVKPANGPTPLCDVNGHAAKAKLTISAPSKC
ncbi:MAG: Rrf2 family transcriptional regulator [Phycisphaerales bacterium]